MQDESVEGTGTMVDESATQGTKICVDYEPCKKTEGCSRLCPIGQKHRGACVVGGKMLKPDKMQTEDDEPKAGVDLVAHHVLGADRVLRQKKHPMEKFLEDAESSLNMPQVCPDMAAMAARYETLQEDEVIVPSSKGHTTASAAAMMKKWGKNEIPEEKEPLWKMFAMQFVGTMPAMVRMRPAPPTTHRVAMPHTARCPASTVGAQVSRSCNR